MSPTRRKVPLRAAGIGLCACVLAACLLAFGKTGAAAGDVAATATLDRSVRFLQDAQNLDGGFGGRRGGASDPDFSAWAAYALAAAGINPQDQAQPGGADVFDYLAANTAGLSETTDFDRVALVALASGTSPYAFGGVDPVATILSRQLPDGSFPQRPGSRTGWINSTIWSIFPLSAIAAPEARQAVREAAEWLLEQGHEDGSWGTATAGSEADADMTGAAIQAFNDAGMQGTAAEARALGYLRTMQGADGGFRETGGGPTNSATTAWVLQGLWAAGVDPRSWRTETGADPLAFLASLQRADGSIGWTATDDTNSVWMTAQAGPALAGHPYPLAAVPRAVKAPPREPPARPVAVGHTRPAAHRGHGGHGVVHGDGVVAGGGGSGAKPYSAPQPQSGGETPGGSRQLEALASELSPAAPSDSAARSPAEVNGLGGSGKHASGKGRGGSVEGVLVGADGRPGAAAPGLFGADGGGDPDPRILFALVAALAAALGVGFRREALGLGEG
jgi:hypothetical protein